MSRTNSMQHSRLRRLCAAGFTLTELLVSATIMLLIVTVIVVRFSSFDSTVLLRSLAFDIAYTIRQTQAYSVGALGTGSSFRIPYGVTFTPGQPNYRSFGYIGSQTIPRYDGNVTAVETYTLGRSFTIYDVCVVTTGSENCTIPRVDISFRRPDYKALFYVYGWNDSQNNAISKAIIKVRSGESDDITGVITIGYAGQVSVDVE